LVKKGGIAMKVGISMIYKRVDESAPNPGSFALECEKLGLESVWVGDHMLFHAAPKSQFPAGGTIPDHYAHFPEPFIVLAMAAATTSKLRIGTSVLLVPEHPPLPTAKRIATLDRLSGGRLILGVGAGWLREAAEPLGSDFAHRWTQTAEHVAAMRELWSKPAASFHGKYANFDDIVCNPKPLQQPGPPVLIGSTDKNALKWVARWGDGYNPVCFIADKAVSFMNRKLAELKEECSRAGRDFSKLDITVMISLNSERAKTQQLLAQLEELGVNRVVEVSASEPLFSGDYRAKLERLAGIALP
jgi:probable F420-dependent oxidoreductase